MANGSKKYNNRAKDESEKVLKSRQSAKECRVRKKMRYQYLEELISCREKAVFALRTELEMLKQWCIGADKSGSIPAATIAQIKAMKEKLISEDLADEELPTEDTEFMNLLLSISCTPKSQSSLASQGTVEPNQHSNIKSLQSPLQIQLQNTGCTSAAQPTSSASAWG